MSFNYIIYGILFIFGYYFIITQLKNERVKKISIEMLNEIEKNIKTIFNSFVLKELNLIEDSTFIDLSYSSKLDPRIVLFISELNKIIYNNMDLNNHDFYNYFIYDYDKLKNNIVLQIVFKDKKYFKCKLGENFTEKINKLSKTKFYLSINFSSEIKLISVSSTPRKLDK